MVFAIKMFLDNTYCGLLNHLEFKCNNFTNSLFQAEYMILKIQILAGNPVNSWFSAGSQITLTLAQRLYETKTRSECRTGAENVNNRQASTKCKRILLNSVFWLPLQPR